MALADDLERIAGRAAAHARPGERVAAVLATEPASRRRVYLCAFEGAAEETPGWLALDGDGEPVDERVRLREAVSIAAMCELAEETAGGGDLDELRGRLVALRITENVDVDAAEAAVDELQAVVGSPPVVASPERLDAIGLAARRLELELGGALQPSPFAEAMRGATETVDALLRDVERGYRVALR